MTSKQLKTSISSESMQLHYPTLRYSLPLLFHQILPRIYTIHKFKSDYDFTKIKFKIQSRVNNKIWNLSSKEEEYQLLLENMEELPSDTTKFKYTKTHLEGAQQKPKTTPCTTEIGNPAHESAPNYAAKRQNQHKLIKNTNPSKTKNPKSLQTLSRIKNPSRNTSHNPNLVFQRILEPQMRDSKKC